MDAGDGDDAGAAGYSSTAASGAGAGGTAVGVGGAVAAASDFVSTADDDSEFDESDFDPIRYINELFPSEQSLSSVDGTIHTMRARLDELDLHIKGAVREQAEAGVRGRQELESARTSVFSLFEQIKEIKAKAEQSDSVVDGICHDIKKLDAAKRNLTSTITALRRLQMLVQAVDKLDNMCSQRQYRAAASLLEAVTQLAVHFDSYLAVPKISELQRTIAGQRHTPDSPSRSPTSRHTLPTRNF